ncbi:TonB family protein [Mucilaginibacter sp.]|uniref:TonB family protein n=1 Tax=Mucilaginibacter sp. TaxID=1882438 RepID=UPI0035BC8321
MKFLFIATFLLCTMVGKAQLRQNVYLLKNNGEIVTTKDSADFLRIIREPAKGEKLYDLLEYFTDGKQKLIGKTSKVEMVTLEGPCLTFFNSGQRKSIATYEHGHHINDLYEYYPSGKLHVVKHYPEKFKYDSSADTVTVITDAYDSLGVATVVNRKGYYTDYNEDFTEVAEQGPIENGKKSGEWKGADKKDTVTFKEKYNEGILIEGSAVKNGRNLTYSKARYVPAGFPNGEKAFGMFLARAIRYPAAARENNVQGMVVMQFFVEKDGTLTNIKVVNSVEKSLDDEALRALKGSPKWTPATKYGLPIRIYYTIPVQFALAVAR